jgi:tetraacyldisaccharide 4'-kinase
VKPHPLLRLALLPFSCVFGGIALARARLYRAGIFRQRRLPGIVISVGNLTTGGTGKTPLVLFLARQLAEQGKAVAVLTRGYRGSGGTSDEVQLLRTRLGPEIPVGVGADRYREGLALERNGVGWFVLDDGFQHLRLGRDADIVLLDATDPFGGGDLLPAGRLREPRSALARADIVVITRSAHAPAIEAVVRRFTAAPVFYSQTILEEVRPGENSRVQWEPAAWLGKRAFAFCAIGNSRAFFDDLRGWGVQLAGTRAFADHHRYTAREVAELESSAQAAGAEILMATEKDAYNLGGLKFSALPLYHLHVTMQVTEAEKFWQALEAAIEMNRRGRAR